MHAAQKPGASTLRSKNLRREPSTFVPFYSHLSIRTVSCPGAPPQRGHAGLGGSFGRAPTVGFVSGPLVSAAAPTGAPPQYTQRGRAGGISLPHLLQAAIPPPRIPQSA